MSATANYVRVELHHLGSGGAETGAAAASASPGSAPPGQAPAGPGAPKRQLLCTMRSMLKKMKQTVLVGDHVKVANINWKEGRAQARGAAGGLAAAACCPPACGCGEAPLLKRPSQAAAAAMGPSP